MVTSDYFTTVRATLLRGRAFNERDNASAPPVTMIDRLLAEKIFPGENPIGKRLRMDPADTGKNQMWEIVGVVDRIKARAFDDIDTLPVVYFPQRQVERTNYVLLVRAQITPASLEKPIREIVAAIDPAQPVFEVRIDAGTGAGNLGRLPVRQFPPRRFLLRRARHCRGRHLWGDGLQRGPADGANSGSGWRSARNAAICLFVSSFPTPANCGSALWPCHRSLWRDLRCLADHGLRSFLFGVNALDPRSISGSDCSSPSPRSLPAGSRPAGPRMAIRLSPFTMSNSCRFTSLT